ncbi:MAG TPA: type IV toxin-antitoxin system AbiEi family antitoxin domain-containing protein [Jatrophihabitantaceae bacterium]
MDWRDLARRQAGVVSRRQLARCGVSEDRIDGLVRRRELLELLPGVYAARPAESSTRQRLWTAQLWSGGVISHRSAAALWKLPVGPLTTVHVTVADRRYRRSVPCVHTHRVPLGRLHHLRFDGLRVTDRTRTVIDLLRIESLSVARDLFDRALQRGWLTEYDLDADLRAGTGRTGNGQIRRLLGDLEPGAHAESERRLHRLLRRADLAGWTPQYVVRLPSGVRYLDVAFPEHRLAVEVDGRRTHGDGSDRFEDDRVRQNELIAAGWRVLRVTWAMLTRHPDAVIAQIAQLLAA